MGDAVPQAGVLDRIKRRRAEHSVHLCPDCRRLLLCVPRPPRYDGLDPQTGNESKSFPNLLLSNILSHEGRLQAPSEKKGFKRRIYTEACGRSPRGADPASTKVCM